MPVGEAMVMRPTVLPLKSLGSRTGFDFRLKTRKLQPWPIVEIAIGAAWLAATARNWSGGAPRPKVALAGDDELGHLHAGIGADDLGVEPEFRVMAARKGIHRVEEVDGEAQGQHHLDRIRRAGRGDERRHRERCARRTLDEFPACRHRFLRVPARVLAKSNADAAGAVRF